jgi:aerobic C4-dicarboxylate transport protein
VKKLFTNLTFWVLIAITAAILIGYFAPSFALYPLLHNPIKTKLLGQEINVGATLSEFLAGIFISTVKLLINPIIFVTITLGISWG